MAALAGGVVLIGAAHRFRARNTKPMLVLGFVLGAFFMVVGTLALIAFAVDDVRRPVSLAIGGLLIIETVFFWIAGWVVRRRAQAHDARGTDT